MAKYKVGEIVTVIKYNKVHFDGEIHRIDKILSANMKRAIGYWYIIKPLVTIDYYCKKGELEIFTDRDIAKREKDHEETKKEEGSEGDCS